MSVRKRKTLKNYFARGSMPSEQQFSDFIDSIPNIVDDGVSKSPEDGFRVSALGRYDTLVSFSREGNVKKTLWSVSLEAPSNELSFTRPGVEAPVLTLGSGSGAVDDEITVGRVGINQPNPSYALDVDGVIRSTGRLGGTQNGENSVPADGKWHDITGSLDGCHAFEVMAGVGNARRGRYALLHARALNTFNPTGWFFNFLWLKRRIRKNHAYYGSKADKIAIRWTGSSHDFRLQLRSNTSYGDGVTIRFYITQLWFDRYMGQSIAEQDNTDAGAAP